MADKVIVCVFLVSLLTLCACRPQEWTQPREDTCGYRSCPAIKEDRLNVHLVPHTHDDVGWLKTVDQYFYGYKNNIQTAGVQYIIDSVIQELVSDPSKRFIYVEIAFFARWFREQDGAMKETVKNLVNQGRLEFILGGWCQNDEASTHYNAIIDQHELGFKFLKDNFGECGRPRVGWQVDPFGHSRELASLFARFGFDGYFFGRLDYQDKNKRLNETNMEFVWHASPNNLGKAAEIFTGVLYNGYGPPGGFCFDIGCQDDPIMDDPNLHDYNVDQKVQDFVKAAKDQAKHYRANHIMMTMGSDFQYQNAHTWYKNMDKLIKYVNEKSTEVNVLYSTPSCYLYNVNHLNQVWNSVSDDFFPYADGPHSYWTGYFTSRAALKGYVRDTNRFLQACKQLTASGGHRGEPLIEKLKEAMGVAQHHDAVSGTEKQAVADDYALRLASGRTQCEMVMNEVYSNILALGELGPPMQEFCPYLNISKCSLIDEHEDFVVLAYNPLLREVTTYLRIPVADMTYTIEDQNGTPVEHELFLIDNETLVIPERNGSKAVNEIVFQVTLPAGGFNLYIFNKPFNPPTSEPKKKKRAFKKIQAEMSIANEFLEIKFDNNGHVSQMVNRKSGTSINLQHEFMYYQGYQGNNSNNNFQASGAYIFRNNGSVQSFPSAWFKAYQPEASEKHWVEEVHLYYSGYASQVIRLYQGQPYAEVEWTVGPIDISDGVGKEIISRYTSDLNSEATFYTDSNGREMMERTRNHRKTWDLNVTEPIAGNYYPVNSRMYIRDTAKNLQLTIMTDRSQGGSSLASGQMELMVHRRLVKDDSRGVGENLNETGVNGRGLVIRGKHYLILESIDQSAAIHRDLGLRLYMAPTLSFMIGGLPYNAWIQKYRTMWTPVKTPLPPNVHLLTFDNWMGSPIEPIEDHQILLRLEHFYEANENTVLSKPAMVDLSQMFDFELKVVEELTLGGNLPLANLTRLSWTSKPTGSEDFRTGEPSLKYQPAASSIITLNPMEIRTFKVMRLTP